MKTPSLSKCLSIFLVLAILLTMPFAKAAAPAHWKDSGFSIDAGGMTLRQVLDQFGQAYGVRVETSVNVSKVLKGRMQATNGMQFLDHLALAHGLRWFVYNNVLYVAPLSDNISLRLQVGEDAAPDAKAALTGLGLFESRFGWGELADEGVVIVSGPQKYVNLAKAILLPDGKKPAPAPQGKQLMVFRLKYASATDRIITSRGQKETVPGVKTILAALLNPTTPEKITDASRIDISSRKKSREPKIEPGSAREVSTRRQTEIGRLEREADADQDEQKNKGKEATRDDRPKIDADPSLNALIIYDNVSKRPMYQDLIVQLDVEPAQVEIEALIVDIDRNKLSEMGVEWGLEGGTKSATVNATTGTSAGFELPVPGSTLLIRNIGHFYARLKAMEGKGEARVLAKPTVLTLENVAAVLDLSQSAYLPLIGERVVDLANVTAGTMLKVVPRLLREGASTRVRLDVDIEDGALGDTSGKTNVTRSSITTQAIVNLQQTLMIGGYHAESKSSNESKVPVMGDLPLIGGLFRTTTEGGRDRERLFLITPRLVGSAGTDAPKLSSATLHARTMAVQDNNALAYLGAPPAPDAQPVEQKKSSRLQMSATLSCTRNCAK